MNSEDNDVVIVNDISEEGLNKIINLISEIIGIGACQKGTHVEASIFFFVRKILMECPCLVHSICCAMLNSSDEIYEILVSKDAFEKDIPKDSIEGLCIYFYNLGDIHRKYIKENRSKYLH